MSQDHIVKLLEESIEQELGTAALYRLFSELYPHDAAFWSQLQLEEKSHATLLRVALNSYEKRGILPERILSASIEGLVQTNAKLAHLLDRCKTTPPDRRSAFEIAMSMESETGEKHYNVFMEKDPESPIEEVFQQLNREDKHHEIRIRDYFENLLAEES